MTVYSRLSKDSFRPLINKTFTLKKYKANERARLASYNPTGNARNPILSSEIELNENLQNGCFNLIKRET